MGTLGAYRGDREESCEECVIPSESEESGVVGREGVNGGRRSEVRLGEGGSGVGGRL